MSKTTKYVLLGGAALVGILILTRQGSGVSIPGLTVTPANQTLGVVTAAGTAATGLAASLASIFGAAPAPVLSSGTTVNANDAVAAEAALDSGTASQQQEDELDYANLS